MVAVRSPLIPPVLVILVVTLAACTAKSSSVTGVHATSSPLPALNGVGLDGKQISGERYRGNVLVVNVWASWCGPCMQELPQLVDVAHRYAGHGVDFVGINSIDQVAAARTWVDRYHIPYPSISDRSGRYAAKFGYFALPDTYVVDRSGTIRYVVFGATDAAQLSGLIDTVLAGSAG